MARASRTLPIFAAALALAAALGCASPRGAAPLRGELTKVNGLRVLRVWGNPDERGYAHGRLLAPEILAMFEREGLMLPQCRDGGYESRVLPQVRKQFRWDADIEAELAGLLRGMADAMRGRGGLKVAALGRDFGADDLKAMNSLADWYRFGCSTFTLRPSLAADGKTLTARNLDFPLRSETTAAQIVEAVYPRGTSPAWVTVTWPGSVGAYTGMSARGVIACLHDSENWTEPGPGPFRPRALAVRRILETADSGPECKDQALRALGDSPFLGGNIIHVAWKCGDRAATAPAAAFECDGEKKDGAFATARLAAKDDAVLVTTNHYRSRAEPGPCRRYDRILQGIGHYSRKGEAIDLERARRILRGAEQSDSVHSAYLFPETLEIHVSIGSPGSPSPRNPPAKLTWAELFPKR